MANRAKYGDKEIRAFIEWFEDNGWRVEIPKGGGYAKALCPCGLHQRRIRKTPSDPNYILNARKWAERQPCWKK